MGKILATGMTSCPMVSKISLENYDFFISITLIWKYLKKKFNKRLKGVILC